jgi:glycosyltransferase involved in cell wall biosynthesis
LACLEPLVDRTAAIGVRDVVLFACLRNEALRLPHFLRHYRALGVRHFAVVDNGSTDGTTDLLRAAGDVSVWRATGSYRASRYGMDWVGGLMLRHGHGRWCVVADADELLVYPGCEWVDLPGLASRLEAAGQWALPALMLDLYPRGPLSGARIAPGDDPVDMAPWFDAGPYRMRRQEPMGNAWVQGGPRARVFYADAPDRAPTLNKFPFVRWHWRHAWVTSTHAALPPRLNAVWPQPGEKRITGVLLHTKFLADAAARAAAEEARGEHFAQPPLHGGYYAGVAADPDLWTPDSLRYTGWQQLVDLSLMSDG